MDLGIAGRVALVFGASGGLGGACARLLAAEGAAVALAGRNKAELERVAAEIGASTKSLVLPWELSELSSIDANVSAVEYALGPVDILFNNTGGPPPSLAQGLSSEVWSKHFHTMVASVIAITDRVLPNMKARHWGRVITSTSSSVIAPIPNLAISNTLRAALVGWSKTLSREVAREGITVNVIAPGRIDTKRVRNLDADRAKREQRPLAEVQADGAASVPIGRYGEPDEFAAGVAFLASSRASYITGSILRVDGGLIPSV
jgi:3-oxoacyl-[acyl-carrier protein] reductase